MRRMRTSLPHALPYGKYTVSIGVLYGGTVCLTSSCLPQLTKKKPFIILGHTVDVAEVVQVPPRCPPRAQRPSQW